MLIIIKGSEVRDGEPRRYADDYADALATLDQVAAGAANLQAWATADSPFAIVDRPVACRRCSATMRPRDDDREWFVCDCPGREVRQVFVSEVIPEAAVAMFDVNG